MNHYIRPHILVPVCIGLWLAGSAPAADPDLDSPMYRDPALPVPRHIVAFPPGTMSLWLRAFERPEIDVRYRAALAIAKAKRLGLKDTDGAIGPLARALEKQGQDDAVRQAVAQALIDLDARSAAAKLWDQAQSGNDDLRNLIEPALARWGFKGARATWLQRLDQADARDRGLLLAIRALGTVREPRAIAGLRRWIHKADAPPTIRVEAARALDAIGSPDLEDDAKQLLTEGAPGVAARIAAVSLLRQKRSDAAVKLLTGVLHDPEPTVVRIAVTHLNEINPEAVLPDVERLLTNSEAEVRLAAIDTVARLITVPRLRLLAERCIDSHPQVRTEARRRLKKLASRPELRPSILKLGSGLLNGADWRGQEQAAILLSQLGHRPAGSRLLALLNSQRPEVCLASAWGLRELADPETLPAVLDYVRDAHTDIVRPDGGTPSRLAVVSVFDEQMSQLVQLLGKTHYRPAEPVLRKFLPRRAQPLTRPPLSGGARAAAVWALGLLHEDQPDPALAKEFERRLLAVFTPRGGDDRRVLRMLAVGLGRMHARSSIPGLRTFYAVIGNNLAMPKNASAWALSQLTGQPVPPAPPIQQIAAGWFMSPLWRPPAPLKPLAPPK